MNEEDIIKDAIIVLSGGKNGKVVCDFCPYSVNSTMNPTSISYKGSTFLQSTRPDIRIEGTSNFGDYDHLMDAARSGKKLVIVELDNEIN